MEEISNFGVFQIWWVFRVHPEYFGFWWMFWINLEYFGYGGVLGTSKVFRILADVPDHGLVWIWLKFQIPEYFGFSGCFRHIRNITDFGGCFGSIWIISNMVCVLGTSGVFRILADVLDPGVFWIWRKFWILDHFGCI